jgi:formamidopyrimidine-DNA glycosylase
MTGHLVLGGSEKPSPPHVRARILLDNGTVLLFRDARKFGRIGYLDDLAPLEARLGPEPLAESFTPEVFRAMLRGHRRQIKPLLLDQSFIAGLGNIYVDEALFAARIHPRAQSHSVSRAKAAKLHGAIREILSASIEAQGTTIIDFTFGEGQEGSFGDALQVFGRQGEPCPVCGAMIVKSWVGQRGTHHCPRCQRPGKGAIRRLT